MQTSATIDRAFNIYALSEQAVTVEFGNQIHEHFLQQVSDLNNRIKENPFPGFYTSVPAYTTLTVFFDPVCVIESPDLKGVGCFDKIVNYLSTLKSGMATAAIKSPYTITIPVCYGGAFGPDLEELAAIHNMAVAEVISIHSSAIYKVYMIGFVPGFAYLGGMPELLATPRKENPRKAIPPGSVGIAGNQTGVYPLETPGGWQIIGRTPLSMFNPKLSQPALLKAGDIVRFAPIEMDEFNQLVSA
jgi:inhibitor of KinA